MNDNIKKIQSLVQSISNMQNQLDKVVSFLDERCDAGEVTDEMVRYFTGPTEELERRIKSMVQDVEYMK